MNNFKRMPRGIAIVHTGAGPLTMSMADLNEIIVKMIGHRDAAAEAHARSEAAELAKEKSEMCADVEAFLAALANGFNMTADNRQCSCDNEDNNRANADKFGTESCCCSCDRPCHCEESNDDETDTNDAEADAHAALETLIDTFASRLGMVACPFDCDEPNEKESQSNKPAKTEKPNAEIVSVNHYGTTTVIYWSDKTKTIAVCDPSDTYDPVTGFAIAVAKKYLGAQEFHSTMLKYIPEINEKIDNTNDTTSPASDDTMLVAGTEMPANASVNNDSITDAPKANLTKTNAAKKKSSNKNTSKSATKKKSTNDKKPAKKVDIKK